MSKSPRGALKRAGVGLLAAMLLVFGVALAPPAGATADAAAQEVSGATRYGTASAAAGEAYPSGTTCAVIATGENYPDALAAGGLAGAEGCALLLVQHSDITNETAAAIDDLGVTDCTIVGGTAAVSSDTENNLGDLCGSVDRVAGNDRYETASKIAARVGGGGGTCYVASGEVAADAVVISAAAFDQQAPVLLVRANDIPSSTESALGNCSDVVVVGGTGRISNANQGNIDDASNDADGSTRLAGNNRQETSVDVANYEKDTLGWGVTCVALVAPRAPSGNIDFSPDALSASQLAGAQQCPELFVEGVDSLGDAAAGFISDNAGTIKTIYKIGGDAAIADSVADDAVNEAQSGGTTPTPTNATATSRPELVSASITETRTSAASTATRPPGTYVKYCFDEAVTGAAIDATKFHLYNGDGTRFSGTGTSAPAGQTFTSGVTSADNKCVEVIYPALATATSAANLTLATVEKGAATGAAGASDTNIEGDAPLTPASSSAAAAGVTAAPDLVSVGNFREGSTVDVTAVDFTFDQAAFTQSGAFQLVGTNGTTYSCQPPAAGSTTASGLAAPGGQGTTVITVNCAQPGTPGSSVPFTATNVARGVVQQNAVATTAAGANPNPLEAAPVANSGNSDAPDLVAVVFSPDALAGQDVVSYLFDEAVAAGTVPLSATTFAYATSSSFGIYDTNGAQRNTNATFVAGTEFCTRSSENNAVVSCVLADGVLAASTYVGGNVRAGAVTETDGAKTNGADEEGTSPSAGPSTGTSGLTAGPDLTAVAINTVTTPFGNTTYTATYTFDEDTADAFSTAGIGGLKLYTSDGLELICTALAGGLSSGTTLANRSEDLDNTVTCSSYTVGVGGAAATTAQVHSAVVGTIVYNTIVDETQGVPNPEGAALTTGGNGSPTA